MKQFLSIVLIFTLLIPFSQKLWITIDFALNQEFIAKNICEQKDKEENVCKGSCHLTKQLKEAEKSSQSPISNSSIEKLEISQFLIPSSLFNYISILDSEKRERNNFRYKDFYTFRFLHSIFHPPTY